MYVLATETICYNVKILLYKEWVSDPNMFTLIPGKINPFIRLQDSIEGLILKQAIFKQEMSKE